MWSLLLKPLQNTKCARKPSVALEYKWDVLKKRIKKHLTGSKQMKTDLQGFSIEFWNTYYGRKRLIDTKHIVFTF